MIVDNKSEKSGFLNFLFIVLKVFILLVFAGSVFFIGMYFTDIYVKFDHYQNNDLVVLKRTKQEIVIPYVYSYVSNKEYIDYQKDENETVSMTKKIEEKVEKSYSEGFVKKDKLYDVFYIKKFAQRFDVNLREMGNYNFLDLLDSFSTAPFYDKVKKTLYIFSHSSGKMFNPGEKFYELEIGDTIDFIDYDGNIIHTYMVDSKDIVPKNKFNEQIFLSVEDKIVLVTCYPMNSTAKRMVIKLSKVE